MNIVHSRKDAIGFCVGEDIERLAIELESLSHSYEDSVIREDGA